MVFRTENTIELIVRAHNRPRLSSLYDVLECWQINLAQSTLGNPSIDAQAIDLLIIGRKMLQRCAHALRLHTFHNANSLMACQIWVFRPIFEGTTTQRVALNIHARTQNNSYVFLHTLLAHGHAHFAYQIWIPRARHACCWREAGCWNSILHIQRCNLGILLTQTVRTIGEHVTRNTCTLNCLEMPRIATRGERSLLFKS